MREWFESLDRSGAKQGRRDSGRAGYVRRSLRTSLRIALGAQAPNPGHLTHSANGMVMEEIPPDRSHGGFQAPRIYSPKTVSRPDPQARLPAGVSHSLAGLFAGLNTGPSKSLDLLGQFLLLDLPLGAGAEFDHFADIGKMVFRIVWTIASKLECKRITISLSILCLPLQRAFSLGSHTMS